MTVRLNSDETLEDLGGGLKILQKKNGFKFGTDAVLLADFAKGARGSVLDLCSGTAIVPLLLSVNTHISEISALEIQPDIADMAARSVGLNLLENKIRVTCGDLKRVSEIYPKRSFDAVTCNPPYMKHGGGIQNEYSGKTIARHEVCCTLEDVIVACRDMLKSRGRMFMVHKPNRLAEIIYTMSKHKIEPKRMRLVYASRTGGATLVLIEGMSDGGVEMSVEPPLYIYDEQGGMSAELKRIYDMKTE